MLRARGRRAAGRCRARGGRCARASWTCHEGRNPVGRTRVQRMGEIRFGPSGLPVGSFQEAAAELAASGYRACEIGFAGGFWLDYETAPQLAAALRAED